MNDFFKPFISFALLAVAIFAVLGIKTLNDTVRAQGHQIEQLENKLGEQTRTLSDIYQQCNPPAPSR